MARRWPNGSKDYNDCIAGQDHPHDRALQATIGDDLSDSHINHACEMSYRRGFDQGVAAALEAMRMFSASELAKWKARVRKWRLKNHRGKIEYPEWLGR